MGATSVLRKAHYPLLAILALYPVILVLLTIPWFQRQFVFLQWVKWPIAADLDNPERYGLAPHKTRNFLLQTPDGESLGAWHVLPRSTYQALQPFPPQQRLSDDVFERSLRDSPTVLYFHGNAATRAASHRVRGYSSYSGLDCNVIAVDYRGFANSTGTPSEEGLITDARTIWDYVESVSQKSENIVLVGQSLGTGVVAGLAGQLASEDIHPRAIVLVAPFTSVTELLEEYWIFGIIPVLSPLKSLPWAMGELPAWHNARLKRRELAIDVVALFKSMMRYPFDSSAALAHTRSPILNLHARDDDVIPHSHSERLFTALKTRVPNSSVKVQTYERWGTVSSFDRPGPGEKGEVIWWDGLRGGHNDIGWAEGSIDLVRRIAQL